METFSIMFDIDKLNIYWNEFKDEETIGQSDLDNYNKYVQVVTQLGEEPLHIDAWMSVKGKKKFEAIDTNLLIKLSGKDAKQWVKTQKKNVLYSRLLELEKQILLNPNNSHHLFMPIVDDIIASPETGVYGKIYVEVEGNPVSDSPDLINSLMPHTQVKNGIIFVKGKFGVGIVALAITGHSTSQADNVTLNNFYIKGDDSFDTMLRFEGMEDNYSLNNYTDNENNIITEFLSQLLTTQVDNVKNPVGIKLGINNQTLNVVEYLNRRGVGPETIIAFIKQPLIQEYLIEQRINESVLYKSLNKEIKKADLINKVLSRRYSQEVIKEQFNNLSPNAFINKQNLISSIKNKTFDVNQIQYFNYFLELIDQSRYLSDFSQEQTADTKAIKNKTGYESVVELIDRSTRSQIVPIEIQTNVRTSGVIAPFTLARQNYYTKFKDMYLTNHNSIFNSFTEYKKTLVSIQKTKNKKEKVGTTFENDFVLYFAMKYVLKNIDPNYYNKLFGLKGYTSLAERVIEAKDKFENNIVLNAFLPLLKTRQDEVTNDYLNNLRLFEREINNTDANDLINSIKELAEQDPQLFRDLVVFSLIQSGFNNSPFNYLKIIPQGLNSKRGSVEEYEYIINDIVNDAINAIHASIVNNTIKQDIDQYFIEFQRNNPQYLRTKAWKNYPLDFTIGFEKGKLKLFSYDSENPKQKTQVPIYGSTYHKRYGLSYGTNSIQKPMNVNEDFLEKQTEINIQMQPDNVQKILNGVKTSTVRSQEQADKIGIRAGQSELVKIGGKIFKVTNKGLLTIEEAGGKEAILKSEGVSKVEDFKYQQTKDWVNGKGKLYVYTIESEMVQDTTKPEFNKLPSKSNTKTFTYAGIGSRETPPEVLNQMTELAKELESKGYTLRSGGAQGADTAFEKGSTKKEIFYAKDATDQTRKIAKEIHPNPSALGSTGLNLMARNTNQIFGKNLDTSVDFVIAWTKDGLTDYRKRSIQSGGTGQAIDMASRKGIPVINMKNPDWRQELDSVLEGKTQPTQPKQLDLFKNNIVSDIDKFIDWLNHDSSALLANQLNTDVIRKFDSIDDLGEAILNKVSSNSRFIEKMTEEINSTEDSNQRGKLEINRRGLLKENEAFEMAYYKIQSLKKESNNNAKQLQTTQNNAAAKMDAEHDSLFPQYEYFNKEQKEAMANVIANNETQIECKFTPGTSGKFGR